MRSQSTDSLSTDSNQKREERVQIVIKNEKSEYRELEYRQ